MKNIHCGIIGKGTIGSEIYKRTMDKGWNVDFIASSKGIYDDFSMKKKISELSDIKEHIKKISKIDVIFLCIPTFDDGKTAFKYIKNSMDCRIPVVTCEKGALSNYYPYLSSSINNGKIGYSATVGGGSRILPYLKQRVSGHIMEIHAVLNGTLNYIFDGLSKEKSMGVIVDEAQKLGFAEPGAKNPLEVINSEATKDVPMKTAILFNVSGLSHNKINAKKIHPKNIDDEYLEILLRESEKRRYIVSITRERKDKEDVLCGFRYDVDGWHISAGFKNIKENPLYRELVPNGVNNAILTSEGMFGKDGSYILKGPGAGAGPTSLSMMLDAEMILDKHN